MPQKENFKALIRRKRKTTAAPRPNGKNYLFIVAINDYSNYSQLYNAVEDAKAIEQVLEERYAFDEILALHDKEATRDNILAYLEELETKLTKSDNLFIFYSGHGYAQKKIGYIIPQDAPANTKRGFIPNSTLLNHLRMMDAHHILLVLDSCFSGSLLVGKDVQIQTVADRVDDIPSRYAISAGNIELVSDGIAGNHSPFAQSIISFLKRNQITRLPVSHLFMEVRKMTTYNARQTPLGGPLFGMNNQGGEFVFHLKDVDPLDYWKDYKLNRVPEIQAYLTQFPDGPHRESAFWKIAQLLEKDWAYDDYLKYYPSGHYAAQAIQGLQAAAEEERLWKIAKEQHTLAGYRNYLHYFPNGSQARLAKNNIQLLRGEQVQNRGVSFLVSKNSLRHQTNRKNYSHEPILPKEEITSEIIETGTFTDGRDGKVYKTVKLRDGLIWMAENCNYEGVGCFYQKDKSNGEDLGRLYTWEQAKFDTPTGWSLPSDEEWSKMRKLYGSSQDAYKALILGGTAKFNAVHGGARYPGVLPIFGGAFSSLNYGYYWTATSIGPDHDKAWSVGFSKNRKNIKRGKKSIKEWFSVRYVKNRHQIMNDYFWKDIENSPIAFLKGHSPTWKMISLYYDEMLLELEKGWKQQKSTTRFFEILEEIAQKLVEIHQLDVFAQAYSVSNDSVLVELKNTLNFAFMSEVEKLKI